MDTDSRQPQSTITWRNAWDAFAVSVLENRTCVLESTPGPDIPPMADSDVELLAHRTDTPLDTVRELYRVEREKLEHSARIKTFVPVLALRRVKELLLVHRGRR